MLARWLRVGFVCLMAAGSFSLWFFSRVEGSDVASVGLPLSVAPAPVSTWILPLVLLVAIVVAVAVAVALRGHLKIVAAAVLIGVAVVAVVAGVWYAEANINYWFVGPYTTWTEDNPLTMYCKNTGHLAGTFDLELLFTNAHFSLKTSLPYQLVDDRTVKFTFTLQPGETQNRTMWFIIDNNVTDFYIDLSFRQNNGNLLVRSESGGVNNVSYQKDVADANFTMRTFLPPP